MRNNIFIVGLYKEEKVMPEIQGVFDTEEKAVAICTTTNHFVMPMELNKDYGFETIEADSPEHGGYFPIPI